MLCGLIECNIIQTPSKYRKLIFIVIKLLLIHQRCRTDSGAELWPWSRMLQSFESIKHTNICAKLQLHFPPISIQGTGAFLGIFLLIGCLTPVAGQFAQHSCLNLPTRIWVTQEGLGQLNFIWPLFKMEVLFKLASVWFLLTCRAAWKKQRPANLLGKGSEQLNYQQRAVPNLLNCPQTCKAL